MSENEIEVSELERKRQKEEGREEIKNQILLFSERYHQFYVARVREYSKEERHYLPIPSLDEVRRDASYLSDEKLSKAITRIRERLDFYKRQREILHWYNFIQKSDCRLGILEFENFESWFLKEQELRRLEENNSSDTK